MFIISGVHSNLQFVRESCGSEESCRWSLTILSTQQIPSLQTHDFNYQFVYCFQGSFGWILLFVQLNFLTLGDEIDR